MSKRTTGVMFCFMAVILTSTRYICAAILGVSVEAWDEGYILAIKSLVSFFVGIVYIMIGES